MSGVQSDRRLHPLIQAQLEAVEPHDNIWLSASAGTGKTQVLTARVIRLLLEKDVEPSKKGGSRKAREHAGAAGG